MKSLVPLAAAFLCLTLAVACSRSQSQPLVTPAASTAATPASTAAPQPLPSLSAAAPTKEALIEAGNTAMDAKRYAEAIIAYQGALDLDPSNVDVRTDMGTCYRSIGQSERALAEYQKGLAVNPRHPNANRNSGIVLAYDLKRPAEAVKAFQKYLEVWPQAPDAAQILAMIQEQKGK
ncbi:MAG: tetratricopeptide repeat protein [Spirochaetota bacterium]